MPKDLWTDKHDATLRARAAARLYPEAVPRAPAWKFLLASLLGRRAEGVHGKTRIVCYRWRGVLYTLKTTKEDR